MGVNSGLAQNVDVETGTFAGWGVETRMEIRSETAKKEAIFWFELLSGY